MPSVNGGPSSSSNFNPTALLQSRPKPLTASRSFFDDNSDGSVYDCITTSAITLTINPGLNWSKGIVVQLPVSGANVTIQGDGTIVQLNGSTSPITKTLSSTLRQITITPRSAPDSYEVTVGT
jgi:hypothetical protein